MLILGLDSSAVAAGAGIVKDGKVLSEAYLNVGLTHSETLLSLMLSCLQNAGLTLGEIDALAVAHGPGSFTGVRIGVAAVKGLCFPDKKPVYGISTLEALAVSAAVEGFLICPVMDARCQQVYTASFRQTAAGLERLTPDRPLKLEELASELRDAPAKPLLVGDGAALTAAYLREAGPEHSLFPEIYRYQHGSAVAFAAWKRAQNGEAGVDPDSLVPHYLRQSQAERERAARMAKGSSESTVDSRQKVARDYNTNISYADRPLRDK